MSEVTGQVSSQTQPSDLVESKTVEARPLWNSKKVLLFKFEFVHLQRLYFSS